MRRGLLLAVALGLGGPPALACDVRLERVRHPELHAGTGYDGFARSERIEEQELDVRHVGGDACDLLLTFTSTGGERRLRGPGGRLAYVLQRSPARAAVIPSSPSARAADLPTLRLAPGEQRRLSYFVRIPAEQVVPSGTYQDTLSIALFEFDGAARNLVDEREVTVSTEVVAHAEINVAGGSAGVSGSGSAARIDFGRLVEGAERRVLLQVRSSDRYDLVLSSDHGGALQNEAAAGEGPAEARVDYRARLDGLDVPFAAPGAAVRIEGGAATGLRGASLEFAIRIGSTERKLAGRYRDTINVLVEPR